MHLSIYSQKEPLFSGEVTSLRLPGSVAPFQVLKHHIDMVTTLEKGTLTYHPSQGKPQTVDVEEGVVKIKDNTIMALVTCAPSKDR